MPVIVRSSAILKEEQTHLETSKKRDSVNSSVDLEEFNYIFKFYPLGGETGSPKSEETSQSSPPTHSDTRTVGIEVIHKIDETLLDIGYVQQRPPSILSHPDSEPDRQTNSFSEHLYLRKEDPGSDSSKHGRRKPWTLTGIARAWSVKLASRGGTREKKERKGDTRGLEVRESRASSATSQVSPTFSTAVPSSSSQLSTTSPSSTSTASAPSYYQPLLSTPIRPPVPYQCTLCLSQCVCKYEWTQHESHHFPTELLFPSSENEPPYWDCGFCPLLLQSWDERMEHIGKHYGEEGLTMGEWNPTVSPAPLGRRDLVPYRGYEPSWDGGVLLGMQKLGNEGNRIYGIDCRQCSIYFRDTQSQSRHLVLYHQPTTYYICPPLSAYRLFAQNPPPPMFASIIKTDDYCQCCGTEFSSPPNWKQRLRHLTCEHHFDRCEHNSGVKFFEKIRFVKHLAECHGYILGSSSDEFFMWCRKEERPLALEARGEELRG